MVVRSTSHDPPPRARNLYDGKKAVELASKIPAGVLKGNFFVKDPETFAKATNSRKVTEFVYIGNEALETDEARGMS